MHAWFTGNGHGVTIETYIRGPSNSISTDYFAMPVAKLPQLSLYSYKDYNTYLQYLSLRGRFYSFGLVVTFGPK